MLSHSILAVGALLLSLCVTSCSGLAVEKPEESKGCSCIIADSYHQRFSKYFNRVIHFSPSARHVHFVTSEFDGREWVSWISQFPSSFVVDFIRSSSSEEYVIVGHDETTGETIIESWNIPTPIGGYMARRSSNVNAWKLGTSAPFTTLDVGVSGGTYLHPDRRQSVEAPRKKTLYRGVDIHVRDFVIDPEGRYLIIQDEEAGSIFQLVGQQRIMLADAQDFPLLLTNNLGGFWQHSKFDRVFITFFDTPEPVQAIVLHDPDNDGVFNEPVQINEAVVLSKFPMEEENYRYRAIH